MSVTAGVPLIQYFKSTNVAITYSDTISSMCPKCRPDSDTGLITYHSYAQKNHKNYGYQNKLRLKDGAASGQYE